ncbi:MAG: hypothetical protein AB7G93_20510 [Bdellovibrionales bacterium]
MKLLLGTAVFASGCVTVNLGSKESKRASGVEVRVPALPFEKEARDDVDAAWKNPRTGNVISYLSDCKDPSDPPLDQIVHGVLAGLSDLKYESSKTESILGREGRRVHALGKVDGVPTGVDLLVFKRNNCIYVLSYVGVQSAFAKDQEEFNRFIEGFQAP